MHYENIRASNVPEFTLRAITPNLDNLEVPTLKENKTRSRKFRTLSEKDKWKGDSIDEVCRPSSVVVKL